jgi:replicative DNA helicase
MANNPLWYEQVVIGGLFFRPERFYELNLTADQFFYPETRNIWRIVEMLAAHGKPIDLVTVCEGMESANSEHPLHSAQFVKQMMELNVSGANLHVYADIVRRLHRDRMAKAAAQTLLNALEKESNEKGGGSDAINATVTALLELYSEARRHEYRLPDAIGQAFEWIDQRAADGAVKVTTGLVDLDQAVGGWHPGDLVVIAARPAMGKTALALNFAHKARVPVGIISTEQPAQQLGLRFLSMQSRVPLQSMRTGSLTGDAYQKLSEATAALHGMPIYIADHSAPNAAEIVAQGRKWRTQYGIDLLIVDYLQRIAVSGRGQRHEEVAQTAIALKNLARELGITVIALAQLNRNAETRSDKRPQLSDLRDSGMIEQEADQVISLYRDEEYNPDTADRGIAELDVLKNRHGKTGVVKVAWLAESLRFENLARGNHG